MTNQNKKIMSVIFVTGILLVVIGMVTNTIFNAMDEGTSGSTELRDTPAPSIVELSNLIVRAKKGELDVVDITATTSFSWDRLFMFGDYTSPSEIDSVVGKTWRDSCYTQISVSDAFTFLVFIDDGKVTHCFDYPKNLGVFLVPEQAYHDGLSTQEARFIVNEYGDLVWLDNN